jgi:DNA-binding transcriptional LysR family regulator
MAMELRQLNHLLAIAEKGTIGKAAESLGISQPALTKSIRTLESSLKVKLLERRPRGVSPTTYGHAVIASARSVRSQIQGLSSELQALRAGAAGIIRFGMAQGVASRLIPRATMRLLAKNPNLRLSATTGAVDRLVPLLKAGEIEFAVTPFFGSGTYGPAVVEDFLFQDRPAIVARPSHELARYSELAPQQLADRRWILSGVETPLRRAFDRIFVSQNLPPPTPAIESDSVIYTKAILMETDYAAFFPPDEIFVEEKAGLLRCIPVKTNVSTRRVGILSRRAETLSPFARQLIEETKAVCREEGYIAEEGGASWEPS